MHCFRRVYRPGRVWGGVGTYEMVEVEGGGVLGGLAQRPAAAEGLASWVQSVILLSAEMEV